jgi:uncharacterized protein YbjQ (UPF0145 family)
MVKCIRCNRELTTVDPYYEVKGFRHCEACFKEVNEFVREQVVLTMAPPQLAIPITTAQTLEGFRVIKTIEVITAECVFGMNFLRDVLAEMSDFFGGRSRTTQNKLREARKICLRELRAEAESVGANAVIAVDLDYSEFSGQGKSMLFLVASGTAVIVDKIELAPPANPPV